MITYRTWSPAPASVTGGFSYHYMQSGTYDTKLTESWLYKLPSDYRTGELWAAGTTSATVARSFEPLVSEATSFSTQGSVGVLPILLRAQSSIHGTEHWSRVWPEFDYQNAATASITREWGESFWAGNSTSMQTAVDGEVIYATYYSTLFSFRSGTASRSALGTSDFGTDYTVFNSFSIVTDYPIKRLGGLTMRTQSNGTTEAHVAAGTRYENESQGYASTPGDDVFEKYTQTYRESTTGCTMYLVTYKPAYAVAALSYDEATSLGVATRYLSTTSQKTCTETGKSFTLGGTTTFSRTYTCATSHEAQTTCTETGESFALGRTTTFSRTYTCATSHEAQTTVRVPTTVRTKTHGAESYRPEASLRPRGITMLVVDQSDCIVCIDQHGNSSYLAPGTYTSRCVPGNVVEGGAHYVPVPYPTWSGGGVTATTYSYGNNATSTIRRTVGTEHTFEDATAVDVDPLPLDGRLAVVEPLGTTANFERTFTYSSITYTEENTGDRGRASEVLPGYITFNAGGYPFMTTGGGDGAMWTLTEGTASGCPKTGVDTYFSSASWEYTVITTTTGSPSSYVLSSMVVSEGTASWAENTGRWGSEVSISGSIYKGFYTADYFTNTYYSVYPDLRIIDGMRGFAVGSVVGTNLAAGAFPPFVRDSMFASTRLRGPRVLALGVGASGKTELNGVSYSTTYIGNGAYHVCTGGSATSTETVTPEGEGMTYFSGIPTSLPVTAKNGRTYLPATTLGGWNVGEEPHDRTITFRFPGWSSRASFGAWLYTSINTQHPGTTTGILNHAPGVSAGATSLALGSECYVVLSTAPGATTSTYRYYQTYTTYLEGPASTSSYDMWKY